MTCAAGAVVKTTTSSIARTPRADAMTTERGSADPALDKILPAEYVLHVRGLFAVPEWYRIAGSAVGVCATGFGTGAKYP
jgi:hypothetical protein